MFKFTRLIVEYLNIPNTQRAKKTSQPATFSNKFYLNLQLDNPSKLGATMFTEVTRAEYVDGFRIKLWFNNNVVKTVDLRSSLNGLIFEPLKDLEFFKRFSVKYNTIEWENGADFAPEYLFALPEA
jgi:hypothetical protein